MSIFRKLIGDKLADGSSQDLYTRCRMNFIDDPVQIKTPQFMGMGFIPSMHWMKTVAGIPPIPESKGL